ncbi:MAG: diaminobutyrate acetyltransferase [Hyphomonas sp.]|uniref:diaminobutyrate acetyltransferase n=1 Tax=Hyphomonas sp. TaxID=87 RepID=UPI001837CEF8|nr:diaminobutyrate acetyltransferase [Hyphomonas sp.]MBA3069221.1 diaminobutyrate acetyltransferase [Hyphomonas sp.]MBU3920566.1 diaminobutyrate acetyltransferase [Alphaproteobacteria bacterium]MBU4061832.1 diaminobutyrate acetyltransferase [Alphaproteobacteria bacterium]MBU4163336.1 diaminobutyrate acetyltransferase [Alphaproteobacteria bacterium]
MSNETAEFAGADPVPDRSHTKSTLDVRIAPPVAEDAAEVNALIAACPPLDSNSLYANLIQCTHFAETCAVAWMGGKIAGWISGHRPPSDKDTFFLWQVAVRQDVRGRGLPRRMLAEIFARPAQSGVDRIQTSITRENEASWALFRNVSTWLGAPMREEIWFDREKHFGGRHASEFLVSIGPFSMTSIPT